MLAVAMHLVIIHPRTIRPKLISIIACLPEVLTFGKQVTRDTLKGNKSLVTLAVQFLGTRVSVPTCQTHVAHLYSFMEITCPST